MKIQKVLIPLDGSDFSKNILPYIRQFFDPKSTEVVLFHLAEEPRAVHIHEGAINVDIYVDEAEASKRIEVELALRDEVEMLQDAGFSTRVLTHFDSNPAKAIVEFVELAEFDLVAMTTHGRTGLRRALTGSVAEYVLRHVDVPVLLLRPSADQKNGKHSFENQGVALTI